MKTEKITDKEFSVTGLYHTIFCSLKEILQEKSEDVATAIMPLFKEFIEEKLEKQSGLEDYVKYNSRPVIIQAEEPYWTQNDKEMVEEIINDSKQEALLDGRQIYWLESLLKKMDGGK